jgi:tetratricopeptide (TPR) repeat protein
MTESVDYTIQRTELLMGLFFLLTLYCAIRGFGPPERRGWYGAALAAFVLGLGSKEVIVVAPAIVLVYDWLFDSEPLRDALRRHWRLYAGYAAVLGLYVLFVGTRLRRAFTGLSGRAVAPWDYALTQSAVIVHYLRLALWPHPLAADYDGWPIATSPRSVLPYLAVVLTIVALTLWGLVRRRKLAFLGAWFLFILAPTSSVRPIATEVAAERRMYLPVAALVVLAVLGGWEFLRRWEAPRAARFAAVAALALTLTLVTVRRNDDYRTVLGFWSDAVAKRPDSPRARLWLGYYLYKQGRNAEALRHETEAVRLQPENGEAQYSLGVVLTKFGRMDDAIHRFRQAIRINPRYVEAHYNLAIALSRQGRKEQAAEHLETAIRLQPDFSPARNALSNIRGGAIR